MDKVKIKKKDYLFSNIPKADKIVFFICLFVTIGLLVGGFFVPPMGIIDGSVLTAGGIIFAFAVLGVGAQAVQDGKRAIINHGDTHIEVRDNEN